MEIATGLSKILNGESYDCVLIDADISEIAMVDFLHQTFKHQPHLSIIMMASDYIRMQLLKETLENEVVMCLPKPCSHMDICNIWKHVCRKRISFEGCNYSNGESPEENQEPNIFKRVDRIVKKSTTLNPTLINKNLSSGRGTQDGLKNKSREYDAMFKPITYEEVWSNDHDQEHVVAHKRTHDQLVEDDRYYEKRKSTKKRITWAGDLHKKFVEAINALGKQKAYPTAILKAMKVPGLTRNQVASHLQKYQEHKKTIKKPTLIPQKKKQVESYAYKRGGQSNPTNGYESILQSSQPPLMLNSTGMSYMTIDNIKARLQGAPPLPIPQLKTTINNSCSDQSTYHPFYHTSIGETSKITTFGLAESCNSNIGQSNEVQISENSYESATGPLEDGEPLEMASTDFGEVMAPLDATSSLTPLNYLGIATKQWVSGMAPSYYGLENGLQPLGGFAGVGENYNLKLCEISNTYGMTNSDGGRISASSNHNYLIHSQDFQGNGENLFPTFPHTTALGNVEHSINPNFSNSNLVPFGVGSVGYSHRQAQTLPPFNSLVSVDGIERTVIESNLFADETQYFLEMTVNLLDVLDADLINGPW
ncbi:unnamed protein product [Lactuca virosa]|uniref:HTH myb-type domain-containing protein n=1 Tax=Lactuca virosa TaxID=75947 RepID=A0AAU9N9U4_9ASTR|nr:unnamed protein product [Lactuca virosa]